MFFCFFVYLVIFAVVVVIAKNWAFDFICNVYVLLFLRLCQVIFVKTVPRHMCSLKPLFL